MTGLRYLDQVLVGDHLRVGELCVAQDIITHRRWWQFWRPRWWSEQRMCLVLADRSLLDVTPLLRAEHQPSGKVICRALAEIDRNSKSKVGEE
jgi:hypothetical protein